jgi:hypothetical protein
MKYHYFAIIALLIFALVVVPVSAFTAERLSVNVQQDGDANVQFTYHLNFAERAIYDTVYDKLPASTKTSLVTMGVQSVLPGKTVSDIAVSRSMATLTVLQFADVTSRTTTIGRGRFGRTVTLTTFTTPGVDFTQAQTFLDKYPLASSIRPDYNPALTIVRFPGNQQTYRDRSSIPSITFTQRTNTR